MGVAALCSCSCSYSCSSRCRQLPFTRTAAASPEGRVDAHFTKRAPALPGAGQPRRGGAAAARAAVRRAACARDRRADVLAAALGRARHRAAQFPRGPTIPCRRVASLAAVALTLPFAAPPFDSRPALAADVPTRLTLLALSQTASCCTISPGAARATFLLVAHGVVDKLLVRDALPVAVVGQSRGAPPHSRHF